MSFKFVTATSPTQASEATTLASGNLGSVLINQSKIGSFSLANTGFSTTAFQVTVSGLNTTLNEDVDFSINRLDWDTTVSVSGVLAGRVSDVIFYRYTPAASTPTMSGTFLIRVDET